MISISMNIDIKSINNTNNNDNNILWIYIGSATSGSYPYIYI